MNARAREPSTPENIEGCDRSAMNRKVGEGGGCTNAHPHKTNEGGKGRGSQTTTIPHSSNIIIHDSAVVTVFGTKSIHPKQTCTYF